MFLSMYHGGIARVTTFSLMDRAHGRASSYVRRDIGAIEPDRWHSWHERCRMGATSFVKVTSRASCAAATGGAAATPSTAIDATARPRRQPGLCDIVQASRLNA